jgi:hypothetical protein
VAFEGRVSHFAGTVRRFSSIGRMLTSDTAPTNVFSGRFREWR